MRKKSVGHSMFAIASWTDWRVTRSITLAPASATVAGSRCSGLWTKKTRIVRTRIGTVRRASSGSSIDRRRVEGEHAVARLGRDLEAAPERQVEARRHHERVSDAIGARFVMNAPNDRPVCPAMRMFGGSPMSVAVPPMFDVMISMITSGTGSMSSASASTKVIGTISSTVVTLSRNADSTPVVTLSARTTASGLPRESWPARMASHV